MNHPGVSGSRRRCCVLHSISFCSRLTGAGDSPENQSASYSHPPPSRLLSISEVWAASGVSPSLSSSSLIPDETVCRRWWRRERRMRCEFYLFLFCPPPHLRQRLHFLFSLSSCSSLLPVSDSFSLSSSGGVGAGLLRPLRVGRVLKLHRSRQTRGKPAGGLLSDSDGTTRVE